MPSKICLSDVMKLRLLYRLKEVDRWSPVLKRKESSAEHTYSTLVLADFLLPKMKQKMNRARVFDLLLYHDVAEIEAGDIGLLDKTGRVNKQKLELAAARKIAKQLPPTEGKRFLRLFGEYEQGTSIEAKFARSVDRMDAIVHLLGYKKLWKQWSEAEIRENNEVRLSEFPEMKVLFEEILEFVRKQKYICSPAVRRRKTA